MNSYNSLGLDYAYLTWAIACKGAWEQAIWNSIKSLDSVRYTNILLISFLCIFLGYS